LVYAKAARTTIPTPQLPSHNTKAPTNKQIASELVTQYLISGDDMATIYMSPNPYHQDFEEELNLRKFDLSWHETAGLSFVEHNNRLILATMSPHTPGDRIPRWRTHLRGAWLIKINNTPVHNIVNAQQIFQQLHDNKSTTCVLLFSHPEINKDISNKGLPIMSSTDFTQLTHDQLNNRTDLLRQSTAHSKSLISKEQHYDIVDSGAVLNYSSKAMKLTRGRLLKNDDWSDWQQLEYLQLDQYKVKECLALPSRHSLTVSSST
jgi:hypothetical protein